MTELETPTAEPAVPHPQPPQDPPVWNPPPAASQEAPPPRKSRAGMFFFGALSGCLLVFLGCFLLIVLVAAGTDSSDISLASEKVAVVPIEGEILDARETLDLLHRYARNRTVKAVVVRINSPGGAIAPSQEIYSAIRKMREDGKPVVASLDSVAASGGYYIASACDPIVANSGSITGSIGVIMQWFEMKDLVHWAKLKPETITSGEMKDAGSPFREMTESEREYFKGIITQLHSQFVRDVAEGRKTKMKAEDVAKVADGRIFTGEQALALKLVDQIGTIDDAVRTAGRLGGIEGEPAKLWPRRRELTVFDLLTEDGADAILERIANRRVPKFMYRWQ
ncbi:MAG: signal peptide peptidase SppA [Thermoanaerobaculia bacterium]